MNFYSKALLFFLIPFCSIAQVPPGYWQQEVDYQIAISLNTENHSFQGTEELKYINHSPDTLKQAFFHLYFNAFQPNSMMDVRSRNIPDPDKRVGSRIEKLKENERGVYRIVYLKMNGENSYFEEHETVLKVLLPQALAPGDTAHFKMEFNGQVPIQIRRSGRDNAEGIDYTMTQWYPKIAAYDEMGWHPYPYIGREFYAPFGKFEVNIDLPADYKVAATGTLQDYNQFWEKSNEENGLEFEKLKEIEADRRTWTFTAEDVHDFAWGADPDYVHTKMALDEDLDLHFYYLPKYDETWERLPKYAAQFFREMNKRFGRYPYPQFSVIQGGDGGMEYPMCTMLKGTGKISGLVGVTVHEGAHNWYYGILGINEARFPWMDEGFTSFAEEEVLNSIRPKALVNPHANAFAAHSYLASKPEELEPMSTMADRYERNRTYGINSYSRGEIFLTQLRYIVGNEIFDQAMLDFFEAWKFKHPEPWDLIRIVERKSGLNLDWYYHQWVETNKLIDYGIARIEGGKGATEVQLEKLGTMSMPVRLKVYRRDSSVVHYYIPTSEQYGPYPGEDALTLGPWPWTHPDYVVQIPLELKDIDRIVIDEEGFMADINRSNNTYPQEEGKEN